ncbi:MAG: rubredoxin [Eubacterium sp.]
MMKYECEICEFIYDPELGDPENDVAPGTAFEDLPVGWYCPTCGVDKDAFKPSER